MKNLNRKKSRQRIEIESKHLKNIVAIFLVAVTIIVCVCMFVVTAGNV